MIATRGCPFHCLYCYPKYLGASYRVRSPEEVVDEMEWLQRRYRVSYIHMLDDLFFTDHRWALELCASLRARRQRTGFTIEFGGTCRTNIVADEVLRARREGRPHMLEQAQEVGMRHVGFGIESASPTILKNIDKSGQSAEKLELAVIETQRIMGYVDSSWMIGAPGESEQTVRDSVEFCKRTGLKPSVFFYVTSYPATPFWQLALDKGLIKKAVTGKLGLATEDDIEQYFLRLGEQGEYVRTNFSDLPDDEVEALARWAVAELNPNSGRFREPHSGDVVRGATKADL